MRRRTKAGSVRAQSLIAVLVITSACTVGPKMRGKVAGLEKITAQAAENGAARCAPRELAIAQSQLRFARIELGQGFLSKAKHHLWLAEPNARAALFLSPPEYCTEKQDRDGDGYLDPEDRCPDDPENFNGVADGDGCPEDPDTDGDGVADSVDACVLEPEDADQYLDEDGCPDIDNDLDEFLDNTDQCPNDPEDPDGYEDEDGCPDPDNDQDTVPDVTDQCPNEVGSSEKEPLGCPAKPALVVVTDCEVKITQQIHFEYNKDRIRSESFPVLDAVVEALERNPSIKIEIQGHTDNRGGAAYNQNLSERRAASVKRYLISKQISADRLTSKGYGFDRPLVPNTTDQNRALNRRVQFIRTEGVKEGCPTTTN
ncbi:MAG: OmpA family protein [Polyangiaceae bacterium]|nr:OmpA family protein [Polyangiaceae bacterium]